MNIQVAATTTDAPTQQTGPPVTGGMLFATVDAAMGYIDGLLNRIRQPQMTPELWSNVIAFLEVRHGEYFDREAGPDGAWPELAPYTIAMKGHDKILYEESWLMDSLTRSNAQYAIRQPQPTELIFGTNRPEAFKHQDGIDVPQRIHTGLDEEGVNLAVEQVADAVVQMMFG